MARSCIGFAAPCCRCAVPALALVMVALVRPAQARTDVLDEAATPVAAAADRSAAGSVELEVPAAPVASADPTADALGRAGATAAGGLGGVVLGAGLGGVALGTLAGLATFALVGPAYGLFLAPLFAVFAAVPGAVIGAAVVTPLGVVAGGMLYDRDLPALVGGAIGVVAGLVGAAVPAVVGLGLLTGAVGTLPQVNPLIGLAVGSSSFLVAGISAAVAYNVVTPAIAATLEQE